MSEEKKITPRVLYFCTHIGSSGHSLFGRYGRTRQNPTPWSDEELNAHSWGGTRPGDLTPEERSWKGDKNETEGAAVLSHKGGWTRVGWPDRRHDSRLGSHFDFLVEGTHTFEKALEIAREAYPDMWDARFRYPIVLSRTVK